MVCIRQMERKDRKIQRILITKTTKMKKHIILLISSIVALTACTGRYEDASDKASDYESQVVALTIDSINSWMEAGMEVTLIDVRQQEDFWAGSITGAVNIPRGILEFKIADEEFWFNQYMYPPTKESTIVLVSSNGDSGILAALSLQQMGYTKIYNLDGGLEKNH